MELNWAGLALIIGSLIAIILIEWITDMNKGVRNGA